MPKFKNMRHRVEYAYDSLNVDLFYEGEELFTVWDHNEEKTIERVTLSEVDQILHSIWERVTVQMV